MYRTLVTAGVDHYPLQHIQMAAKITSSLDLFLLGLINSGVNTPYLLRERARLSLGATHPALKRLEKLGLIARGERLQRNKQQFKLTAAGKRNLRIQLSRMCGEYCDHPPVDSESVLRVASLALAVGEHKIALEVIRSSIANRTARISPPSKMSNVHPGDIAESYSYFLTTLQGAYLAAESAFLSKLLSDLSASIEK
jgi:DNA-binding PadR family transcriptional regulator